MWQVWRHRICHWIRLIGNGGGPWSKWMVWLVCETCYHIKITFPPPEIFQHTYNYIAASINYTHQKPRLDGLALAFQNPRPGHSRHEAVNLAWLGLAYLGPAWLGSWPQAGPGTALLGSGGSEVGDGDWFLRWNGGGHGGQCGWALLWSIEGQQTRWWKVAEQTDSHSCKPTPYWLT
jgi:hypothetical protein